MIDKKKPIEVKKFERSYEFEDCTVIWKYDSSKSTTGPYEVEVKYKKNK